MDLFHTLTLDLFENVVARFDASWSGPGSGDAAYDLRLEAGIDAVDGQPWITQKDNHWMWIPPDRKFLVAANTGYVVVTLLLSWVMSRRKEGLQSILGVKIKTVIAVYNLTCVFAAGYVVWNLFLLKFGRPGNFRCNEPITDDVELRNHVAWVFWVFYAQKYWEYMDTWFFILRKSFRQVTFLHLFHHSSITIVVGSILPYDFNGDMFLPILLNSIVHVLMYLHYFVTAIGIKSWWRQYLTSLQLIQFVLISLQSFLAFREGATCGAPDWAKLLMVGYMGSMLVLFGNFFLQRYVLSKPDASMCGVIKTIENPRRLQYTGMQVLDSNGQAVVYLPAWFSPDINKHCHFSYQLTPVGAAMNLYVEEEIDMNNCRFVVGGGKAGKKVSWQVVAEDQAGVMKKAAASGRVRSPSAPKSKRV